YTVPARIARDDPAATDPCRPRPASPRSHTGPRNRSFIAPAACRARSVTLRDAPLWFRPHGGDPAFGACTGTPPVRRHRTAQRGYVAAQVDAHTGNCQCVVGHIH